MGRFMDSVHHFLTTTARALGPPSMQAVSLAPPVGAGLPFEAGAPAGASTGRQIEYATGRACLREALRLCGARSAAIERDTDGVPRIPEGYVASLSHSKGHCLAVAAEAAKIRAVGVDLEMLGRLSAAAMCRVVHPAEAAWVQGDRARATFLFSAKEAFYKMQFPLWRTPANFQDLAFRIADLGDGLWQLEVLEMGRCFPSELRSARVRCRGMMQRGFALTLCWIGSESG